MSRIGRFALVATLVPLLALAGCAVGMVTGTTTTAAVSPSSADLVAADLWDASEVHDIALEVDPVALQEALATYVETGEKVWVEASVTIDGVRFEQVGIKLKGNSSLRSVTADTDPASVPWRIRLDKFVDDQSWDGQTDLVVRGNSSDTSLNEAVALSLLAASGLASEPAIATSFSVNGGAAQLRLVVDNPGDEWAETELGEGTLLYKSEAGGSWNYVGDDPAAYADSFEQEAGDDDLGPLIDFLAFVNDADDATFAAELANHLDVEAFATYLAFQDLVGNTDDIDGPGNNSYLAYDPATGRMTIVSWDLNLAFGASPGGGPGGGGPGGGQGPRDRPGQGGGGPSGGNVLAERFRADPTFGAMIEDAAARLQSELVDSGAAADILASWTDLLLEHAGALVDAATVQQESAAIATALGTT